MRRLVIRPKIQIPILVVLFVMWTLLGITYFTPGDAIGRRDWPAIVLGCVVIVMGIAGVWRSLRLGVVIDSHGVRIRGLDARDKVIPWNEIKSVDCLEIDVRAGLPIHGPVLDLGEEGYLPIRALGNYSRAAAERTVEQLRALTAGPLGSEQGGHPSGGR